MAAISVCYTSTACNRCPHIADWSNSGLICFGYSNAVAIYQGQTSSSSCGIIHTAVGHQGKVNCVSWVKDAQSDEAAFVSGATDCNVNIWRCTNGKIEPTPTTLRGHTGSVTCVSALALSFDGNREDEMLIFSASIDSTVKIWSKSSNDANEIQQLDFGAGFALTLASHVIKDIGVPLLACGCDDHKVHLYAREGDVKFTEVITLDGHEDWVRGLDFTLDANQDVLLASCAQDHLIRVWRLTRKTESDAERNTEKVIADMRLDEDIAVKEMLFSLNIKGSKAWFAASLNTVLSGHENWVYSVKWKPLVKGSGDGSLQLLSASMDKTLILWAPQAESGLWTEEVRVGDVGGNSLGFYGGLFSPCGQSILGHGYQGAFNQWTYNKASRTWLPEVTGGGHFGPVVDLSWSRGEAEFLLSASVDQTTRLHAPWIQKDGKETWCEIARPQVHGYDLTCLTMLGKYSFASGADEKLVRVFKAPRNFISNFCQLCGHSLNREMDNLEYTSLPEGANVPALGLSNKAVFASGIDSGENVKEESIKPGQYPENYFTPTDLKAPPSEDQLLQNTLWPEEGKLYGHGYEIFSLAAHPKGNVMASACKAAKADAANILLWDMTSKKVIQSLSGCTLTVTQMAFSHQGNHLLAVSRDRTWALFQETAPGQYALQASVNKKTSAHSRIIWSCAWTHDDKFFLTASRDKTVCAWPMETIVKQSPELVPKPSASLTSPDSVTAVSTAPMSLKDGRYLVATGLDNGQIFLYLWSPAQDSNGWTVLISLDQSESHHLTVTRLTFRPCRGRLGHKEVDDNYLQLASSGSDHAVRVYDLCLDSLV